MPESQEQCLRGPVGCQGEVTGRGSFGGTGTTIYECERHMDESYRREEELRERYPVYAPADFDPAYAGESWDEDY